MFNPLPYRYCPTLFLLLPCSQPHPVKTDGVREADVYIVDDNEDQGIWDVTVQDLILDPTYGNLPGDFTAHTLSIEVQDMHGVLNQVRAEGDGAMAGIASYARCGHCTALYCPVSYNAVRRVK